MSDVPHIGFILAAYAVTATTLIGMIAAVLLDGRGQRRQLARIEARVSRRRQPDDDARS